MEPIANQNALVHGFQVAYGIYGDNNNHNGRVRLGEKAEPVVLIHGTPSSSMIWRNVVPGLVAAGFEVYVYDLLGYGVSERPLGRAVDTSMTGQVSVLEGLLSLWGFRLENGHDDGDDDNSNKTTAKPVHIVAHDIGGGIAQRFAVSDPARVRSLTLVDTVSFDSYPSARTKQQMEEKGLESLIKAPDEEHREHFRAWLLSAVCDKDKFRTPASGSSSSSALDTYLEYISGPIGQASLFEHQVRHYDPKHTMEVADRLHALGARVPVQIIWGSEDS
ncbi:alpha/beta hydrolase [Xylariaceae sp. FL0594]|nr:alpha/beta hydrolase [Xylariaceae sp. FL0594]